MAVTLPYNLTPTDPRAIEPLMANFNSIADKFNGNVTTADLADDGVTAPKILDGEVITSKLPDLAVTTEKLNDLAVTSGKLSDKACTVWKRGTDLLLAPKVMTANAAPAAYSPAGLTLIIDEMTMPTFTPLLNCYARVTGNLVVSTNDTRELTLGSSVFVGASGAAPTATNPFSYVTKYASAATNLFNSVPVNACVPLTAGVPYVFSLGCYSGTAATITVRVGTCMFVEIFTR